MTSAEGEAVASQDLDVNMVRQIEQGTGAQLSSTRTAAGTADTDEEICRICRCGSEDDRPLFYPCVCSGSMKHVHEDCLSEWLAHTNSSTQKCELCGHKFEFTALYAPDAPENLSNRELTLLFLQRVIGYIPFLVRIVLVVLCWGVQVPMLTCVLFRKLTLNSWESSPDRSALGWVGTASIVLEDGLESWKTGICVNIAILVSFIALLSVCDFVRFHFGEEDLEDDEDDFPPRQGLEERGQDVGNADALLPDAGNQVAAVDGEVLPATEDGEVMQVAVDGDVVQAEGEQDEEANLQEDCSEGRARVEESVEPKFENIEPLPHDTETVMEAETSAWLNGVMSNEDNWGDFNVEDLDEGNNVINLGGNRRRLRTRSLNSDHGANEQGILGGVASEEEGNQDVAGEEEPVADNVQRDGNNPPVEEPNAPLNDNDFEDLGAEEGIDINIALDELIGLRGPIHVFLHHSLWCLMFNMMYLSVFLVFPTTMGTIGLMMINSKVKQFTQHSGFLSTTDEDFLNYKSSGNLVTSPQLHSTSCQMTKIWNDDWSKFQEYGQCTVADTFSVLSRQAFLEATAVSFGFLSFSLAWFCCLQFFRVIRATVTRNPAQATGLGLLLDYLILNFNFFLKLAKVVFLLIMKMGAMPVFLGVLLERCTRPLFTITMEQRYAFVIDHPIFTLLIYWVSGISHMLVITIVLLQLREVLHPDLLHSILRAHDTNVKLLRTLLLQPLGRHLRRMVLSCAIYTLLVMAIVYLPVRLAQAALPRVLPLALSLRYVALDLQLPGELVCFHIGLLHMLDNGKPFILRALQLWLEAVCGSLGLTRYLLPCDAPGTDPAREKRFPTDGLLPREAPHWLLPRLAVFALAGWATAVLAAAVMTAAPLGLGRSLIWSSELRYFHDLHAYIIGWVLMWQGFLLVRSIDLEGLRGYSNAFRDAISRHGWVDRANARKQVWYIAQLVVGFGFVAPIALTFFSEILWGGTVDRCLQAQAEGANQSPLVPFWQTDRRLCPVGPDSVLRCITEISLVRMWFAGFVLVSSTLYSLAAVRPEQGFDQWNLDLLLILVATSVQSITQDYNFEPATHTLLHPLLKTLLPPLFFNMLSVALYEYIGVTYYGQSPIHELGFARLNLYAFSTFIGMFVLRYLLRGTRKAFMELHDVLRDEKYLVGKKLLNLGEKNQMM